MDLHPRPDDQAGSLRDTRPIVVGVSVDDGTASAVVWATDQAQRTGRVLRLVSACRTRSEQETAGHDLAVLIRRLTLSSLEHRAAVGPLPGVLLEAATDAELVVVGRRHSAWLRRRVVARDALNVVNHATVPVVVVPETWIQPEFCAAPIVLGLEPKDITTDVEPDRTDPVHEVIAFAFDQAAERGVPLRAVSAWTVPPAFVRNPREIAACHRRFVADLEARLRPWRDTRPEVEVDLWTVAAAGPLALLDAGRTAQLTVIGRHAHPHLPGATVRALVHRSRRPVAVIPVAGSLPEPNPNDGRAT